MKRHILLFTTDLLLASACFAQKNSILISGEVQFTTDKSTVPGDPGGQSTSSALGLAPQIGYQFNRNWTVGVIFDYQHQGYKDSSGHRGSDYYSGGPFARYTYSVNKWLSVYGQLQATWNGQEGEYINPSNPTQQGKTDYYDVELFPALLFNLGKGWGINFSLGGLDYNFTHVRNVGTINREFDLNFGSAALIGISKNIGLYR